MKVFMYYVTEQSFIGLKLLQKLHLVKTTNNDDDDGKELASGHDHNELEHIIDELKERFGIQGAQWFYQHEILVNKTAYVKQLIQQCHKH